MEVMKLYLLEISPSIKGNFVAIRSARKMIDYNWNDFEIPLKFFLWGLVVCRLVVCLFLPVPYPLTYPLTYHLAKVGHEPTSMNLTPPKNHSSKEKMVFGGPSWWPQVLAQLQLTAKLRDK
jgi:hypothetical protein